MKVQTIVLLLCFLSGVYLSSVVHAKPSPALMKELIALEKYLEKKQGSDGADGQNKNQDDGQTGGINSESPINNEKQSEGQTELTSTGQDKQENEIVNDVGGEANTAGQNPDGEGVTTEKPVEGDTPEHEGLGSSGGEKGETPQEGNGQSQSLGQEMKGWVQTLAELDDTVIKVKEDIEKVGNVRQKLNTEFTEYDRKVIELENKIEKAKEITKQGVGNLKTVVQDFNDLTSNIKKSVKVNAPARRSHVSDTEFLNIVHSLLTDN